MKILRRIAAGTICLVVSSAIFSVAGCSTIANHDNNEEVSIEESTSVLNLAVAYAQERNLGKLCDLSGSKIICQHQWEDAGGEQTVPVEPPKIVDTYLLPTVHLKNKGESVGGRVLVLEGVDGLGKPYRTEFLVFRSGDSGSNGLAVTNVVYWSGYGIATCNENGVVTTAPSPSP